MAAAALLASSGCRSPEESEAEVEIVDVGESVDHAIDVDADPKAVARRETFRGVMPGDFPSDVWVYEPAAVIDFGEAEGGRRFVVLRALEPAGPVATNLTREMRARGWTGEQRIDGEGRWTRDGREIVTSLTAEGSETLLRLEYR